VRPPQPPHQCLIGKPLIDHQIHGRLWCLDLDRRQQVVNRRDSPGSARPRLVSLGEPGNQACGLVAVFGLAKQEAHRAGLSRRDIQMNLDGRAGIEAFTDLVRQADPFQGGRCARATALAQELAPTGGKAMPGLTAGDKGAGRARPRAERIAGENGSIGLIHLQRQVMGVIEAIRAQYPFEVERDRDPPRPAGLIGQGQLAQLDRMFGVDMNIERLDQILAELLESTESQAVADAAGVCCGHRCRRRRPHFAGFFVP